MIKKIGVIGILLLSNFVVAQTVSEKAKTVQLEGLIVGVVNSSITLINQNVNQGRTPISTIKTDENGAFKTTVTIPFNDYYYLKTPNGQGVSLVLNENDTVKIYADSKSLLYNCNLIGSQSSDQMLKFYQTYVPFKQFEDSLKRVLKIDRTKQTAVNQAFKDRATTFYAYRNKFIQDNSNSPALIAVLPSVNEKTEFELYKQLVNKLKENFPTSPTTKLLGNQLKAKEIENLNKQKIAPGKPAPEIIVEGVDGKTIKLSDLKGKVVLIDMWASWCGPCRRENPNVVKAYDKYHKDGFEVFSVSFDKPGNKDRWLAAIAQDGLTWESHGSELKGFNNQAARDYSVRGIPFTCLVDAEGNIVKTNLRGPALEAELKKIFGH